MRAREHLEVRQTRSTRPYYLLQVWSLIVEVHTFLNRKGTLLEHAILLCGLFLGRGVNAYVAIGKTKSRPYCWVVTIEPNTTTTSTNREERTPEQFLEFPLLKYQFDFETEFTDGPGNILSLDKEKFKNSASEENYQPALKVIHWDVMSGSCFSRNDEKVGIFERIETLFNHERLYFNVQKSNLVMRSSACWDVHNTEAWIPFLPLIGDQNRLEIGEYVPCCKSTENLTFLDQVPSFLTSTRFWVPVQQTMDRLFLARLVTSIQTYRSNTIFIPTTHFHRQASQSLQSVLGLFEKVFIEQCHQSQLSFFGPVCFPNCRYNAPWTSLERMCLTSVLEM